VPQRVSWNDQPSCPLIVSSGDTRKCKRVKLRLTLRSRRVRVGKGWLVDDPLVPGRRAAYTDGGERGQTVVDATTAEPSSAGGTRLRGAPERTQFCQSRDAGDPQGAGAGAATEKANAPLCYFSTSTC
jgi:hypothetical protein